jgi:phage I-like protein
MDADAPHVATCDVALPPGAAPEWVHLLPPEGRIVARDGRRFVLRDPAALVADFEARGVDLPVDFDHQTERARASASGPVPAAGWIKALRADAAGVWGRVEWTERAAAMIAAREYRYLSPAFLHDKAGTITRLKSAGLVHDPALQLTALASEDRAAAPADQPSADMLAQLRQALGLSGDAGAEDVVSRIVAELLGRLPKPPDGATLASETAPDPARFVPVEAMQALLSEHNGTIAAMRESEAKAKVDRALLDGHITPAMRDWALGLCRHDPDSFETFPAKSSAPYAALRQRMPAPAFRSTGQVRDAAASPEAAAICAQLGLPPGALNE